MAILSLTNASVVINSVDLSDHVRQVNIKYSAKMNDASAMGADTTVNFPGLKDWSMDIEFNQDYAASEVDATLFPLVGAAAFPVVVKAVNATTSATNPAYSGSAVLADYPPITGKVGDLNVSQVTLQCAGTLSRLTA